MKVCDKDGCRERYDENEYEECPRCVIRRELIPREHKRMHRTRKANNWKRR